MLDDESLHSAQLDRRESKVTRQRHRGQPELRRVIIAVYVDVRWLMQVVADEVETIGATAENRGHPSPRTCDGIAHDRKLRSLRLGSIDRGVE